MGQIKPTQPSKNPSSRLGDTPAESVGVLARGGGRQKAGQSKIELARQHLMQQLARGVYRIGSNIPTEDELAAHLGYSRSTIREAVSSLVHDGMLDRRQGSGTYVVNNRPLNDSSYLAMLETVRVGLVVSSRYAVRPSPYLLSIVKAFSTQREGMPAVDVRFLVGEPAYRSVGHLHFHDAAERSLVDALIFTTSDIPRDEIDRLTGKGMPMVFFGGAPADDHDEHSRVWTDLAGGVSNAVTYLHSVGRTRPGMILAASKGHTASEFLAGMVAAQVRFGLAPDISRVHYTEEDLSLVPKAVEQLVRDGIDSLLCCDDVTAEAALAKLAALGVAVPEQVAVIGANDTSDDPKLSTLAMPYEQIGRALIDLIFAGVVSSKAPTPRQQVFMPRLVIRDSVPARTEAQTLEELGRRHAGG